MASSSKTVLAGVAVDMHVEPVQTSFEAHHPPVDPHVRTKLSDYVRPLGEYEG